MKGFPCIDALPAPLSTVDENMPLPNEQGSPVKSGRLYLTIGQNRQLAVFVNVYWSGFEHFAVIYRDKKFCNASAFIRIKRCVVTKDTQKGNRFVIIPNNSEGCTIVFECETEREADDWVKSLSYNSYKNTRCCLWKPSIVPELILPIPKIPVLPTLKEYDEDEDV